MAATRTQYEAMMSPDKARKNRLHLIARINHSGSAREFIHDCADEWPERDAHRYPDPFLQDLHPNDYELIATYRHKVATIVNNLDPENEQERIAANALDKREQNRYNILLGKHEFPTPREAGIDPELAQEVKEAGFTTGYGFAISTRHVDWDTYDTLMHDVPLDTLRYLAAYTRVHDQTLVSRGMNSTTRILNAIRYVRGDPTVSLDAIIDFTPLNEAKADAPLPNEELEEGIPFERVRAELQRFTQNNPTTLVALGLANVGSVQNLYHPEIANGRYFSALGVTNFSEALDEQDEKTARNVVLHEVFHSIQDILGALDLNVEDEAVNLDCAPDEWRHVVFFGPETEAVDTIQEKMLQTWFRFRTGEFDALCDYQRKNIHEFFAVALEAYVENPDTLQEEQPPAYDVIDTILTVQIGE